MIRFQNQKSLGVLGLGEVMLRLSPPGKERISFSESFEKNAGGSELNVVSGICSLGIPSGIITKIPESEAGKFVKRKIKYFGANTDYVLTDSTPDSRLGIYYYECGAYPRPPMVTYDRQSSAFTTLCEKDLPAEIYEKTQIFHTSGITLALGEKIRKNTIKIIKNFSDKKTTISFDVNYRESLWSEENAKKSIESILPMVNVLFISEETARRMFKMQGTLNEIHQEFSKIYPNLEIIASTKRKAISPSKHNFSSVVYDCKKCEFYEEEPYLDIDVIDRVGSGDAYVAGALYALLKYQNIEKIAQYGNAMAAIKNTLSGDIAKCDLSDVERVIKRHSSSTQSNEMVR